MIFGIRMKFRKNCYLVPLLQGTFGATFTNQVNDAWHTRDHQAAIRECIAAASWASQDLEVFSMDDIVFTPCDVLKVNKTRPSKL